MIEPGSRRTVLSRLVALAAGSALTGTWLVARAQQAATPRHIGVLLAVVTPVGKEAQAFRQGLLEAGYTEGREVAVEWRSAEGDYARIPELVADLVHRKVDVIVVDTTVATRALKRATSTIPIVMTIVSDPVGSGLVPNLAHPSGNVTGFSLMMPDLTPRRLQLLKEAIPRLTRVAVLWNPDSPFHTRLLQELKATAPLLSLELSLVGVRTSEELTSAFSAISRGHPQALYINEDPLFFNHRTLLLGLALKFRLPNVSGVREYVDAGGLMSYGANYEDVFRRSAGYVDRILKGAKPGDLPIEQPTKFELVVNLKTAKALGVVIPESILVRADEVIQ